MKGEVKPVPVARCLDCGQVYVLPTYLCTTCGGPRLETVYASGEARLVTHTVIRTPPRGFESQVPYTVGVAELASGLKVPCRLLNDPVGTGEPKLSAALAFAERVGNIYWFRLLEDH